MPSIQQLELQLADCEGKVRAIRQQLREHYLIKAAEYDTDVGSSQKTTKPNGKPTPNRKPRKAKPAGASKVPSKPRNDICPQVRRALVTDLSALTEDTAHHANSIAKAACIHDMPLLSRTLKYMIHTGQVTQVGVKRGARYYITRAGVEAFNADGFGVISGDTSADDETGLGYEPVEDDAADD